MKVSPNVLSICFCGDKLSCITTPKSFSSFSIGIMCVLCSVLQIHWSEHIEGIYVLGCERGTGFIHPRIQQQLQTHDISLIHHTHQATPITHTLEQKESSTSYHGENSGGGDLTSLMEDNIEHILVGKEVLEEEMLQLISSNIPVLFATSIFSDYILEGNLGLICL